MCRVLTALNGVTVVGAPLASAWGNGLLGLFIDLMCFVEKESNYGGFLVRATVHVRATVDVRTTFHVSCHVRATSIHVRAAVCSSLLRCLKYGSFGAVIICKYCEYFTFWLHCSF